MERNVLARIIAVVLIGMLFASYINYDQKKWRKAGREAFLANEGKRFDEYMAKQQPFALTAFGSLFVAGFLFSFYELLVVVLSAVLKSSYSSAQQRPVGAGGMGPPFS